MLEVDAVFLDGSKLVYDVVKGRVREGEFFGEAPAPAFKKCLGTIRLF